MCAYLLVLGTREGFSTDKKGRGSIARKKIEWWNGCSDSNNSWYHNGLVQMSPLQESPNPPRQNHMNTSLRTLYTQTPTPNYRSLSILSNTDLVNSCVVASPPISLVIAFPS